MRDQIDAIWPAVEKQVNRVLDRFDFGYNADHVYKRLMSQEMQLWLCNGEAVAVTEIIMMPNFKVLAVPIVAGKGMKVWLPDLVGTLQQFGRQHDCKYMEGYGRKGWVKALAFGGFKEYSVNTRCEL
ncbi:MAG: hypothetical protein EP323_00415 [Gammaproteobacteria bacterium]|nr:MAG: hypothetical protein EP323_00415 [Gammaproteobacteria bacterium]